LRETLAALIKLQEIDAKLRTLELSKGDLPQKINALEAELLELEATVKDRQQRIATAQAEMRALNAEVDTLREKLKRYQSQLYQVKTNKEYDAITLELETTESAINQHEYNVLELEDQEKALQTELAELIPQLEEQRNVLSENRRQLDEMLAKTHEQEHELFSRRHEITSGLSRPIFSTYERIRHGRSGVAVAFLKDGACNQCSSRIPPQRGLEIRMMNRLFLCEVCGRIMLWDPERE